MPVAVVTAPDQRALENQGDLVWAADVEVVPDDLFEEHPSGDRFVEHLRERELGLQDRQLVAVARGPVGRGERMRQDGQPFTQQRVDLLGTQTVADPLQPVHVVDGGETVVQRGEPDTRLGGLALRPMVAVDAQLGVVREVGAELHEEWAEIVVVAIEVEMVDQPGGLHYPRVIGITVGVAAFLGAEQLRLLLRPADEQDPLATGEPPQVLVHHVVLALALDEVDPWDAVVAGESVHRQGERVGDLRQRRGRGDRQPQTSMHVADQPGRVLQLRNIDVEKHPVDALDLKPHVLGEDIVDRSRYGHQWAPIGRAASPGQPTALCGSYTGPVHRSRSQPRPTGAS